MSLRQNTTDTVKLGELEADTPSAHDSRSGAPPFAGLDLTLDARALPLGAPAWRVEVAPGRIRIRIRNCVRPPIRDSHRPRANMLTRTPTPAAGETVLWARVHRWHHGFHRLRAQHTGSWHIVPPIRAPELRRAPRRTELAAHLRFWAKWFVTALAASERTPLHPGRWAVTPAWDAALGTSAPLEERLLARIEHVSRSCEALREPALAWESWWTNGSGALLATRPPSAPDSGRVRAFTKRAHDGTLAPALATFVTGLDMFVLLDGHDRLAAACAAGVPLPLLVVWPVRSVPRTPDAKGQAAILRSIAAKRAAGSAARRPLGLAAENRLLVAAYDDRDWLLPRSRAYPIAGGAPRWDAEVARASGLPPEHDLFSGEPPALTGPAPQRRSSL